MGVGGSVCVGETEREKRCVRKRTCIYLHECVCVVCVLGVEFVWVSV